MKTWEIFADYFGRYYTTYVACVALPFYFMISLTLGWTSPVLSKLTELKDNPLGRAITTDEIDLIGSLLFVGASLGPVLFVESVNRLGRKHVLVLLSLIVPIGYGIFSFSKFVELYYIGRILLGFYVGATLSVVPVYLVEILPRNESAFLMSFLSLFNYLGLLAAFVIGPYVPLFHFNIGITFLSILLAVLFYLGCPESPYYTFIVNGKDHARNMLKKIRTNYTEQELNDIEYAIDNDETKSYSIIFNSKQNFKPFALGTIPLLLHQFSGMTQLVTYSELIFLESAISVDSSLCSIIVICLLVGSSFLAPILFKSKLFSHKALMVFCYFGMGSCNLILGLYFLIDHKQSSSLNFLPLIVLVTFVLCFNCGVDAITWTYLGCVYPKDLSFVGTAISTSIYFLAIFPVLYLFNKVPISFLFLGSALDCFLGVLYMKFFFTGTNSLTNSANEEPI